MVEENLSSHPHGVAGRLGSHVRISVAISADPASLDGHLFAAGRYLDRVALTSQPYRFIERLVVLDSQKIDTLLVIPL